MLSILERIKEPADLRKLTYEELGLLADEIRQELIGTVANTGGHLASNLGVVELTIALHRVFDSPKDKIIWDVGHQSYTHKLLTGRRQKFSSLRQYQGLSGFIDPNESLHDSFISGHASTSISAALGMAVARDFTKDDYSVVAVIGDGALTGGMAFEALNQAGHLGRRLIIILNDNKMSISPTVGALSKLLNKLWFDRRFEEAEEKARRFLSSFSLGKSLWQAGRKLKHSFKGLVLPASIWEELGFNYIGPFDGHNIKELEKAFIQAQRHYDRPVFIHVVTVKGKGYPPAETDAVRFHGVSGENGKEKGITTFSEVFAQTLLQLMRDNPKIIAVTAAMSEGNCLSLVAKEIPERVFDVGICEQHAITFGAGMAMQGFIPVIAIYSTFLQRAFDQVIHDVCLQEVPVILALDRSGIVGEDGKTHQGLFDLSYLTLIPNLIVSAPKDEDELRHLLYTAVKAGRPMAIRYPRGFGFGVNLQSHPRELAIGKGELIQEGRDVTLVALGSTVVPALGASQYLANLGIEATVINARFAKPIDLELIINACQSSRRLVTVEENVISGGFGSFVLSALHQRRDCSFEIKNIGINDQFVEQGSQEVLRSKYNLDARGITEQVLAFFPELIPQPISISDVTNKLRAK